MATRTVQTTWTDYRCCDDGQMYRFRVKVELEGKEVNGVVSDPNSICHRNIADLLEDTSLAWHRQLDDAKEYKCGECGSTDPEHDCDSD